MSENLLDVKNLNAIYHSHGEIVEAVNGVTFSLKRGETLGLVGETGAGKTTTALSILKLLPQNTGEITSGDIIFSNQNITKLSENEMQSIRGNKISMIFQDPMTSLNPVLTIGDQIAEVLLIHSNYSKENIQIKVNEMLELVGIPSTRKKEYPHQFSGGMKQRVVIAMALACNPELLIADEPTTALDVTIQAQVLELMNQLKTQNNTSILLITHDLGVVAETCENVAIIYAGEIIEYGTLRDVFGSKKRHPYTEGLFGSIPDMNSNEKRLKPIAGLMPNPTQLPKGCKFHPRCQHVMEICKTVQPSIWTNDSHQIKCHLFE